MEQGSALPLAGIRVVELAGLAPGPFAGMVLADFGADVIRIDRPDETTSSDILARGKRSLAVSPKSASGRSILLDLIAKSDVLIDPFRPGTLEKLGLGPEECLKRNPRLVYARLTGYRKTGPYSKLAGHDINYAALSGVLAMLRPNSGLPTPPMNLLADFAGGGSICVIGILMALLARTRSGNGQVVEADMVSGTRYVSSFPLLAKAEKSPFFSEPAGQNILDGGAPFYAVYRTKDDRFISLGALEPRFYTIFLETLLKHLPADLQKAAPSVSTQYDRNTWAALKRFLEAAFASKTRDHWEGIFLGTDSCVAPVLEPEEAALLDDHEKVPSPAPVLRGTPAKRPVKDADGHYLKPGKDSLAILTELGHSGADVQRLVSEGIIGHPKKRASNL